MLSLIQRYLRYGTRSTAEVRAYLCRHRIPEALGEQAIAECSRRGWLDDAAAARLLTTSLVDRGYADAAISQRLHEHEFSSHDIQEALRHANAPSDEARARALLATFPRRSDSSQRAGRLASHTARRRAARVLVQHGFDPDLIERVLTDVFGPLIE